MCRSYSDLNFGVTFFGTQCIIKCGDICQQINENIYWTHSWHGWMIRCSSYAVACLRQNLQIINNAASI